ncbi:uncharacterized protein LOC117176572 [Belonocnema kinseyi]|uniref:uncharacterized protein LOC117176572 n=1 Tax=Belonocnema kinseyi TaxID=2817044 RepID=UPI00143D611D|nr:uncharacterized protein LOC117176572 [Belonocnema kinseyi]
MPVMPINRHSVKVPNEIFLADPEFHKSSNVDILIGAEYFFDLLLMGKSRAPNQTAVLQETVFGWIFSGRHNSPQFSKQQAQAKNKVACNLMKFHDLPILWELREESSTKLRSDEEQAAESHFLQSTKRLGSGRDENSDLQTQYIDCVEGYLGEGHMSLFSNQEASRPGYYHPHHAVIKEDSLTTKTRVVFDGSAKTSTGVSLNDMFMIGPTIQDDLFSIVTRFRSHPVVITADIQQMYRQIRVTDNDRFYQKVLWRKNQDEPIKTYSLNTVTFADDEKDAFPEATKILKRDFYVDDLQTGAKTINEARQLRDELIRLLQKGGFNLRKWASNKPELSQDLSSETSNKYMSLEPSDTIKALGIHWGPKSDSMLYSVNLSDSNDRATKRSILSQCSKLFDPLGLIDPVIVVGKIIIQQLWKHQVGWDDQVPPEVHEMWLEYKKQLPLLNTVRYQRCIVLNSSIDSQLHGFCDASEKAYGACLYLRSTDNRGNHHCELIRSKSRVASLKTMTLPKLELCAAALLVQLFNSTIRSLQIDFSKKVFCSDSTVALNWINSPPHMLLTFVTNRVSEIQATTKPTDWRHVPTLDNPADCISRGQGPHDFLNNTLWTHGPQWLSCHENNWPQFDFKLSEVPEKRSPKTVVSFTITQAGINILIKYSNFKKLQRVIAYCVRFIRNLKIRVKTPRQMGPLLPNELNSASRIILKWTQYEVFSSEIRALSKGKQVDQKSSLFRLNPFLDDGLIRVGGRLDRAPIPESQKHPIILPKNHHVTKLIIRVELLKKLHAGTNATLYGVRETYH